MLACNIMHFIAFHFVIDKIDIQSWEKSDAFRTLFHALNIKISENCNFDLWDSLDFSFTNFFTDHFQLPSQGFGPWWSFAAGGRERREARGGSSWGTCRGWEVDGGVGRGGVGAAEAIAASAVS